MGRPPGAINKGMRYAVTRKGRELQVALKNPRAQSEQLFRTVSSYSKLLQRAIKVAAHDDTASLQRIAVGLTALTKALTVVNGMVDSGAVQQEEPIDYDVMGRPIFGPRTG